MSLMDSLKQHAKIRVETWRQKAAASVFGPALYEAYHEWANLPAPAWFRLSEPERMKWLTRAVAVLKVVAEQERHAAQQATDQAALDRLVAECYPPAALPSNVTPIRTRRTGEDFEELERLGDLDGGRE